MQELFNLGFRDGNLMEQKCPGKIFSANWVKVLKVDLDCKLVKMLFCSPLKISRNAIWNIWSNGKRSGYWAINFKLFFFVCWRRSLLMSLHCQGQWRQPSWNCVYKLDITFTWYLAVFDVKVHADNMMPPPVFKRDVLILGLFVTHRTSISRFLINSLSLPHSERRQGRIHVISPLNRLKFHSNIWTQLN